MPFARLYRFCLILSLALPFISLSAQSPYDAVDPVIGTAGGGNTFPGATLPFGMVQWSPDTGNDAWYYYGDKTIHGFSLTHISGAGCPLYGDFAILPVPGVLTVSPGHNIAPYAAAFDHSREEAHPGYYALTLASGVRVELTITGRAGIARITFPEGSPARLLVNAGSSADALSDGEKGAHNVPGNSSEITLDGPASFSGSSRAGHFCSTDSHYKIYVVGEFNAPYTASTLWQDDALLSSAKTASGFHTGAWLDFGARHQVLLRVGVSFVSEEGARKNLQAELNHWNFETVHNAARLAWTEQLERISADGGTPAQRKIFYTGVYHSFLSPNLFSDSDGRYIGFDNQIHSVADPQKAQYANYSDWDIYRNTVQFQALFFPDRASDMMQSLVNDAVQSGQLPRWPAANDVTYVMGGDSPAPLIASSYAFGARNFDTATALRFMVKAATETENNKERPFLADYLKLGYVPAEKDRIAASRTLEYASDDFAIAQFARALGQPDVASRFLKQSQNWKNLLDPSSGWIRPRHADGTWLENFDALHTQPRDQWGGQVGFEEGNTAQYTYMIPFDYPALFAAVGGEDIASMRLDKFFTKLRCWGDPCYNIENEPDFVVPYAYVFAGEPWKTQEVVTRIGAETFKAAPDGIPGNDDLGATSGVYVWSALGLYPAVPGVAGLVLGTPMFPRVTLRMANGRTLTVTRSAEGIYVKSVTFNGGPYPSTWLPIDRIVPGRPARLEFSTQATPNTDHGAPVANRPPAFH